MGARFAHWWCNQCEPKEEALMGGHEGKNEGWGKRDQDFGDPKRDPALDEGPDNVPDGMTNRPGKDRGAEPGAHGTAPPQPDIKPGTKIDLEDKT
jgi:hypothetical protein